MVDRAMLLTAKYLQVGYGWGEYCGHFQGDRVHRLDPGVRVLYGADEHISFGRWSVPSPGAEVLEADVEAHIEASVARRLEADVPLGCFLSGGVDSSLIAHFAKQHKSDLMTFSVRMPDPRYDESAHAESVARHLGTDHRTLDVAISPAEDLVHLIDLLGQPFGDSSLLPSYWVSKAAREHVKVSLSGDGGDELFIGYERYMAARTLARRHRVLRRIPAWLHYRAHPRSARSKLARIGDVARDFDKIGVRSLETLFTLCALREMIGDSIELPLPEDPATLSRRQLRILSLIIHANTGGELSSDPVEIPEDDALEELRRIDLLEYLPNDLLTKTDTASMAVALEVRCPFLDRDLARALLAMPIEQLIPNGERKGLLKQIARKYLPREVVDRPKMGFAIPIGEWFRSDFGGMKTLLLDHLNSAEPFGPIELNQKAVQRFIDEHMKGKRDHSHRLFTLLTLSIWAKGNATPEATE